MPRIKPLAVVTSPMKLRKRVPKEAQCDCCKENVGNGNHHQKDDDDGKKRKRIKIEKKTNVKNQPKSKENVLKARKTVISPTKPENNTIKLKKTPVIDINKPKKKIINNNLSCEITNPILPTTVKKKTIQKSKTLVRTESSNSTASMDSLMSFNIKPKTKRKTELNTSGSFEKYGIIIPTMKDVLSDQKELEKLKKQVNELKEIDDVSLDLSFSIKEFNKDNKAEVLSCKHLSVDKLTDLFFENKPYLLDILNGKQYSERHQRFYNYNPTFDLTTKDLNYNTSMILFTYDQIELMTDLLTENFEGGEKLTSYFFKVLLPEFCTKIFMDVHDMTYEEALMYLETRPIEDI